MTYSTSCTQLIDVKWCAREFTVDLLFVNIVYFRASRNKSEKDRRDKLNDFISELATMVPDCSSPSRKLDKATILKNTVDFMKVHNGKLNFLIWDFGRFFNSLRGRVHPLDE